MPFFLIFSWGRGRFFACFWKNLRIVKSVYCVLVRNFIPLAFFGTTFVYIYVCLVQFKARKDKISKKIRNSPNLLIGLQSSHVNTSWSQFAACYHLEFEQWYQNKHKKKLVRVCPGGKGGGGCCTVDLPSPQDLVPYLWALLMTGTNHANIS